MQGPSPIVLFLHYRFSSAHKMSDNQWNICINIQFASNSTDACIHSHFNSYGLWFLCVYMVSVIGQRLRLGLHSKYSRVLLEHDQFLHRILTKDTLYVAYEDMIWGVFSELNIWYKFYHCNCCALCNSIDGLVKDCSNSSASSVEFLQSCTKP